MESIKRGQNKKAQFYIIAAVIIIFVVIGFAAVVNYIQVKEEPKKFYDVGDVLEIEGIKVVDNSGYVKAKNLNEAINTFLGLFANYIKENINEDFTMVIVYGNANSGRVNVSVYSRASSGKVNIFFGSTSVSLQGSGQLQQGQAQINVRENSAEITLQDPTTGLEVTQTVQLLEDNNFAFIMTTSSGFNQYIQSNLPLR